MTGTADPCRRHRRGLSLAALLLFTAALSACSATPQLRRAASGPAAAPQVRSEVLILPLGQKSAEERSYWTLESQRLVLAYFDIFLRHGFQELTSDRVVVSEDGLEAAGLEFVFQGVEEDGDGSWWAYVPVSGRAAHGGRHPDYVLIFDGLRFRIRAGGGARQSYDAPGGGKVEVDLEYILWDNRSQEVAASGQLHQETYTNSPHASSETFKDLFEKMAEEVIRSTPLNS